MENHLETIQASGLDNICLLLSSQVEENLPTKNLPTQQLVQLPAGEIFEGKISMGKSLECRWQKYGQILIFGSKIIIKEIIAQINLPQNSLEMF